MEQADIFSQSGSLSHLPGDENVPHVPRGEHQRREQAERSREARGEADREVGRPRFPYQAGREAPETQLCEENRKNEGKGRFGSASQSPGLLIGGDKAVLKSPDPPAIDTHMVNYYEKTCISSQGSEGC